MAVAVTLAQEAGAALRQRYGQRPTMILKGALDPVTEADRALETLIRSGIQRHFPMHAILGEEMGASGPPGGLRWIVDPLDGTVNFAHQYPPRSPVVHGGEDRRSPRRGASSFWT